MLQLLALTLKFLVFVSLATHTFDSLLSKGNRVCQEKGKQFSFSPDIVDRHQWMAVAEAENICRNKAVPHSETLAPHLILSFTLTLLLLSPSSALSHHHSVDLGNECNSLWPTFAAEAKSISPAFVHSCKSY